jgi:hypothetical protein
VCQCVLVFVWGGGGGHQASRFEEAAIYYNTSLEQIAILVHRTKTSTLTVDNARMAAVRERRRVWSGRSSQCLLCMSIPAGNGASLSLKLCHFNFKLRLCACAMGGCRCRGFRGIGCVRPGYRGSYGAVFFIPFSDPGGTLAGQGHQSSQPQHCSSKNEPTGSGDGGGRCHRGGCMVQERAGV